MKQRVLLIAVLGTAASLTGGAAVAADEMARVLSSTAVMQQVGVPRQACATYATPGVAPSCSTQTVYESRVVGYNVVYELGGRRYSTQLPQDPGPTLRVQGVRGEPIVASAAPVAAPSVAPAPRSAPRASRDVVSVEPDEPLIDAPLPPDWVATQPGAAYYYPPVQVTYAYPRHASYGGYGGYVGYYDTPSYWGPVLGLGIVGGYYAGRHYRHGRWHGRHR